jgi:NAD(P)-dependent dehydrogenase (short-subunit alcohol dehydrogenase family)
MQHWRGAAARHRRVGCSRWKFDRRHKTRGVRATAVHPGGIRTELGRHMEPDELDKLVAHINAQLAADGQPPFQWKTIPQGAATSVWAAFVARAEDVGARTARCLTSPKAR